MRQVRCSETSSVKFQALLIAKCCFTSESRWCNRTTWSRLDWLDWV